MYLLETRVHFQRGEGEQGQKDNLDSVFLFRRKLELWKNPSIESRESVVVDHFLFRAEL